MSVQPERAEAAAGERCVPDPPGASKARAELQRRLCLSLSDEEAGSPRGRSKRQE